MLQHALPRPATHPRPTGPLDRWGERLLPVALVAVGVSVLLGAR